MSEEDDLISPDEIDDVLDQAAGAEETGEVRLEDDDDELVRGFTAISTSHLSSFPPLLVLISLQTRAERHAKRIEMSMLKKKQKKRAAQLAAKKATGALKPERRPKASRTAHSDFVSDTSMSTAGPPSPLHSSLVSSPIQLDPLRLTLAVEDELERGIDLLKSDVEPIVAEAERFVEDDDAIRADTSALPLSILSFPFLSASSPPSPLPSSAFYLFIFLCSSLSSYSLRLLVHLSSSPSSLQL